MKFFAVCLTAAMLLQATSAFSQQQALVVPSQNKEMGTLPPMDTVDALAQSLFTALQNNDTKNSHSLFFPEAEFAVLKDIKDPLAYYKQLLDEYDRDINKQHTQLQIYKDLKYVSWKKGGCKWKAVGSEYNKIAYWSCYRNRIIAETAGQKIEIDIRTLINWGDKWFITHLGRDIKKAK